MHLGVAVAGPCIRWLICCHVLPPGASSTASTSVQPRLVAQITMPIITNSSFLSLSCLPLVQIQGMLAAKPASEDEEDPLQTMMKDQFGNYVVQKVSTCVHRVFIMWWVRRFCRQACQKQVDKIIQERLEDPHCHSKLSRPSLSLVTCRLGSHVCIILPPGLNSGTMGLTGANWQLAN